MKHYLQSTYQFYIKWPELSKENVQPLDQFLQAMTFVRNLANHTIHLLLLVLVLSICPDLSESSLSIIEPCYEKINVLVSDLVRHKPGCTATEVG